MPADSIHDSRHQQHSGTRVGLVERNDISAAVQFSRFPQSLQHVPQVSQSLQQVSQAPQVSQVSQFQISQFQISQPQVSQLVSQVHISLNHPTAQPSSGTATATAIAPAPAPIPTAHVIPATTSAFFHATASGAGTDTDMIRSDVMHFPDIDPAAGAGAGARRVESDSHLVGRETHEQITTRISNAVGSVQGVQALQASSKTRNQTQNLNQSQNQSQKRTQTQNLNLNLNQNQNQNQTHTRAIAATRREPTRLDFSSASASALEGNRTGLRVRFSGVESGAQSQSQSQTQAQAQSQLEAHDEGQAIAAVKTGSQHTTNFPMPKEPQILLFLGTSPPFFWQTKQPYLLADTNLTPKCRPTRPTPTKDQLPFSNHVVCGPAPNPPCNSTWTPTQSTPQRTPMPSYSQKT